MHAGLCCIFHYSGSAEPGAEHKERDGVNRDAANDFSQGRK